MTMEKATHGNYPTEWKGPIWASKQESRYWRKIVLGAKETWLRKKAAPYAYKLIGEIPPAFEAWKGKIVDFEANSYQDTDLQKQIDQALRFSAALAAKKDGQWYAFKWAESGAQASATLSILPIEEADAAEMVRLPDDWESYLIIAE